MAPGRSGPGTTRRAAARALITILVAMLAGSLVACGDDAGRPAEPTTAVADDLLDTLRDGTRTDRAAAADGLAELGDPAAIPALAEALADESWDVRWRAAEALVVLHDARAVDPLLTLVAEAPASPAVADDDMWAAQEAYKAAIEALGLIGDARAVPRLVAIASAEDWSLQSGAAEDALVAIGDDAAPGIADAIAAAEAAEAARIVPLLGRLGEAGFTPLVAALEDSRKAVKLAAATALGVYGEDAVAPLLAALKPADSTLRNTIAGALGDVGSPKATKALVGLLAGSKTASAATRALVSIHADDGTPLVKYLKAKKTVGVYRALIRIGDDDTTSALARALKSFGTKTMGEAYLNCGNPTLEKAAKSWAKAHGYTVVTRPGAGAETWGER